MVVALSSNTNKKVGIIEELDQVIKYNTNLRYRNYLQIKINVSDTP